MSTLLLVTIFLTCGERIWASEASACAQLKIVSIYESKKGAFFQEAVATTIHWRPSNQDYLLTVAHAVHQATKVIGYCQNRAIQLDILGTDTARDVAILAPSPKDRTALPLVPIFNLPQTSMASAIQNAKTQKVTAPKDPKQELGALDKLARKLNGPPALPFGLDIYERLQGNKLFHHLALIHPFFKEAAVRRETVKFTDFNWTPLIDPSTGIYRLQSTHVINQFILNESFASEQSNPFLNFTPFYMTLGVRPGMSGSPVFEYLDTQLENRNNVLVGLVSKTKKFENISLLIPGDVVQTAVKNILQGVPTPAEGMHYEFDNATGTMRPLYYATSLGLTLANICDGDYGNTAEPVPTTIDVETLLRKIEQQRPDDKMPSPVEQLKSSRGGDWGDGGGSVANNSNYLFTPYFTESRYVPELRCKNSGIVDHKRRQYIGYRHGGGIFPLRNLDQFVSAQNSSRKISRSADLVTAAQSDQVFAEVCGKYTANISSLGEFDLIMPRQVEGNLANAVFTNSGPTAKLKRLSCEQNRVLFMELESKKLVVDPQTMGLADQTIATLKMDATATEARISAQLGRCRIESTAKGNAFEYSFQDPQANIRVALDTVNNNYTWSVQISKLSSACGFVIDPKFKGAMLIRFKGRR